MSQDVLGRLIFDGIVSISDFYPVERIKRETGYDVSDIFQYKAVYDYSGRQTRLRVYRYYPSLDLEISATEADLPVEEREELPVKQDMLDKYYGNPEKEKEYEMRIARFKSHIVERDFEFEDEDDYWRLKKGKYKTIEDYPEKEEDERFLQLEDYQYRLERLSKAEAGDLTQYRDIARKFNRILIARLREEVEYKMSINAPENEIRQLNSEISTLIRQEKEYVDSSVRTLQQTDQEYLETNNYAYNQYLSTQKSLRTLGRYGEKVPYLQISDEDKDFVSALKHGVNLLLRGRNAISAPINKAIGTYVVAPVHRIIHDSDKYSKGVYRGLPSHRYTARRDFFTEQYLERIRIRNDHSRGKEIRPNILQLAIGVRLQAVLNYREGNIGVLTKGAERIEEDTLRRDKEERQRTLDVISLEKTKRYIDIVIARCQRNIENAQNEEERLDWERYLKLAVSKSMELQRRIELNRTRHIDSLIQTDAISMRQHDETNKAHVTRVVSGVKNGIRVAATKLIGKKLSEWVTENYTRRTPSFTETITEEVVTPAHTETITINMNEDFLQRLTLQDIVSESSGGEKSIARYANSAGIISRPSSASHIRGVAIEYNGRIFSSGNTEQMVRDGIVNFQMSDISGDTPLFEILARTISANGVNNVTSEQLISTIVNSPDPTATFRQMLGTMRVSVGKTRTGDPYGWLILDEAIDKKASIYPRFYQTKIPEQVEQVERVITHGGINYLSYEGQDILDKSLFGAQTYLYASAMADLYELIRMSSPELAEKTKGLDKRSRAELRKFVMNLYGFTGTKRGDYASRYDENNMGLRRRDDTDKGEER